MKPAIGLQLYSVKNSLQEDYLGALEKIAAIGYQNVELITQVTAEGLVFGQDMRAADLKQHLDRLGLRAFSCHFMPLPGLNLEAVLADLNTLGVTSLVCAAALFKSEAELAEFIKTFGQYGAVCKEHGVQLYYHNHFHEFQVFGEHSAFERMVTEWDKELVKFELDTYWATRAGQDPIYWMKKLGPRCDLIHQKDLPAAVSPVNVFERLGYEGPFGFESFGAVGDILKFAEIGTGTLPIPAILAAAEKYNQARYIIVEQDASDLAEMESIALSYDNLSKLLAG